MNFEQFCRPNTPDDLHLADHHVKRQIMSVATGKQDTGLIFVGPPGTGKTESARVLASTRNASTSVLFQTQFVFEGKLVTDISQIENTLNMLLCNMSFPFIVINEFDQMPSSAFKSLHSFWNVHSNHCGLILTTNSYAAITPAFQSRMPVLDMQCPPSSCLLPKAQTYLKSLGKSYSNADILNVLSAAGNDMRSRIRAIQLL